MQRSIAILILLVGFLKTGIQAQGLRFNDVVRWGAWRGNITSFDHVATVEGLVSRNVLTLSFQDFESNQGDSLEMNYSFGLPKGSVVDSLYLWVGEERVPAALKSTWTAWQIYNSIVRRRWDPALLTTSGNDNYNLRVFPFSRRQERRVQICYSAPMSPEPDRLLMEVPFQLTSASAAPVASVRAEVRLPGLGKEDVSVSSADSGGWNETEVAGGTRVTFQATGLTVREPGRIHLSNADYAANGIAVHFDSDSRGETHFMALMNPRKALGLARDKKPRKILLLWNLVTAYPNLVWNAERTRMISGGMTHRYQYSPMLQQEGREIVDFLQSNLSPGDEVNLMFNDLEVKRFRTGLTRVDDGTLPAMRAFIDRSLDQSTNRFDVPSADDGLALLMEGLRTLEGSQGAEIIVIDRYSQANWWDSTVVDKGDVQAVLKEMPSGTTAYVVAQSATGSVTGKPSSLALIYQAMARNTGGAFINGGYQYYSIAPTLLGLNPFLSARIYPAALAFSTTRDGFAYDIFGQPSRFYLDQSVVVVGKLSLPAPVITWPLPPLDVMTVRFVGRIDGKDVSVMRDFKIARTAGSSRLSKLWAARKVQSILGEGYFSPRLWDEATDWSLQYRILTPMTALLALEPGRFDSTWYQDQKPSNNPGLPTGLDQGAMKRLAPGKLALTQEPGALVIDLSGFEPGKAGSGFTLQVFDSRGRLVADLTDNARKGGKSLRWSTRNLSRGNYLLKLRADGKTLSRAFTIR